MEQVQSIIQVKRTAAARAVALLGGPSEASARIQSLSNRSCSRDRVQKWLINGIATPWHPYVHQLTKIPLTELDPEVYPAYLFDN